jgi:hypothetical protein
MSSWQIIHEMICVMGATCNKSVWHLEVFLRVYTDVIKSFICSVKRRLLRTRRRIPLADIRDPVSMFL